MRRKANIGTADRRHLGVDTHRTRTETRKAAACHRELPDCREHGLQGRLSPLGGPPAEIDYGSNACLPRLIHTFTDFRDRCGCPTDARAYKLRILRKKVLCRRENGTSFPSFRTKTRPPSLLSRGCLTWPRLTIELLLARKNIELSSLRSMLPRERRRRMLPLAKCTSVEFRHASRREIPSICTIQALESSVRKAKSSRRSLAGSPSPKQE